MDGHGLRRALAISVSALVRVVVPAGAHGQAAPGEPDCDGPPPAAEPGTPEWDQREVDNVFCGSQRSADAQSNPAYEAASSQVQAEHGGPVAEDPFRDPAQLNGKRFRWETVSLPGADAGKLDGMLFRPLPGSASPPPYPGVVIVHGGA